MSDTISFAAALALNLLLLSTIVVLAVTVSLRLVPGLPPRLRYVIAVSAFLVSAIIPFAVTLDAPAVSGSFAKAATAEPAVFVDMPNAAGRLTANPVDDLAVAVADSPLGIVLLAVWALGIIYLIGIEAANLLRLNRSRKEWEPASSDERKELCGSSGVKLYFNKDQSPGTAGFLSPAVVLPFDFPTELSIDAKRLIVQHEVAHAMWRDPLVNAVLRVFRSCLWISPALWALARSIENEREAAADAAAIASLSDEREYRTGVLFYADTLMEIAKNSFGQQANNKSMIGLKSSQSLLEGRVRRLLTPSRTSPLNTAFAILTCLLSVGLLATVPVAERSVQASDRVNEIAINAGDVGRQTGNDSFDDTAESDRTTQQTRSSPARVLLSEGSTKKVSPLKPEQAAKFAPPGPLRTELSPLKGEFAEPRGLDPLRP